MSEQQTPLIPLNGGFKNRFDVKALILVMLVILLATLIILWNPDIDTKYHEGSLATLTAQVEMRQKPGTRPPTYPADILNFPEQTNMIILGSVVIMLVVVGGTLGVIQRKN